MAENQESTLRDMLRLMLTPGIGPARLNRLLKTFGSPRAAILAKHGELKQIRGLSEPVVTALSLKAWNELEVERQLEMIEAARARPLYLWESEYPAYLAQIYDPPPLLFVRGDLSYLNLPCFAVVGTRGPSFYGSEMARTLAAGLAGAGFTIVSGLARGIDSSAHIAALDAGGATVAVLGSGVDVVYPGENHELARRITDRGVLISECLMGAPPEAHNFPRRNRLISGLSRGLLLIEAGKKSGALITAAYALDQNREVFALPGDIRRSSSQGTNLLIQRGNAKLVHSLGDILEEFGALKTNGGPGSPGPQREMPAFALSLEERSVFESLQREPRHIDELAETLGIDVSTLLAVLLQLEMKQMVRKHPGNHYSLG